MIRLKKIAELIKPKSMAAFVATLLAVGVLSLTVQNDPQNQGAYALLEPILPAPAEAHAGCDHTVCGAYGQCFSDSLEMYCFPTGQFSCGEELCLGSP